MQQKIERIQITNRLGLHARAAAKLVQLCARYAADLWLTHDKNIANGKSIMGVMMLGASQGSWLEIRAEGVDAKSACAALLALIGQRFGEEN